jgi:hypothetical protein
MIWAGVPLLICVRLFHVEHLSIENASAAPRKQFIKGEKNLLSPIAKEDFFHAKLCHYLAAGPAG